MGSHIDENQVIEIGGHFQELMLSKVQSLLLVVMQKFTESNTDMDLKSNFDKKKNIFRYLDECVCKIGDIKIQNSETEAGCSKLRSQDTNERIGDGIQCGNETCNVINYNLKLVRKKVIKLKVKNSDLKVKLADERFKSKGLLRMAKFLTAKYHQHVKEINDKVTKIGNLEEKNKLLQKDLGKILNKQRFVKNLNKSAKTERDGQSKHCIKTQSIGKMYVSEKNIAMVNSLFINGTDENSDNTEMNMSLDDNNNFL